MTITLSEPHVTLARDLAAQAGCADVAEYLARLVERDADRAETIAAVRESMADVAAGRVRPAREVMNEIARRHGIPPPFETEP